MNETIKSFKGLISDKELNPCEYCPCSHVVHENGIYKAECVLPSDISPAGVLDSRCFNND